MGEKRTTNITVYRKSDILTSVSLFWNHSIYLAVSVLMYLTSGPVSVYEVREGSIVNDTAYTGFVVRSESVIAAQEDGYVNYFVTEGDKVGAKTSVYTSSSENWISNPLTLNPRRILRQKRRLFDGYPILQ